LSQESIFKENLFTILWVGENLTWNLREGA